MVHDPRLRPGWSIPNIQQALARLGTLKLGLEEVEYVSHVVSSTGISLTPEKHLKVLNFPRPQKREAHFYNLLAETRGPQKREARSLLFTSQKRDTRALPSAKSVSTTTVKMMVRLGLKSIHCTRSQSLNLGRSDKITDASIISISTYCIGLQELNLGSCH